MKYICSIALVFCLFFMTSCIIKSHNHKPINLLREIYSAYYKSQDSDKFSHSVFNAISSKKHLNSLYFSPTNDTIYTKIMVDDNGDVNVLAWSNYDTIYFNDNYVKTLFDSLPLPFIENQLIHTWDTDKILKIANPKSDSEISPRTIATLFRTITNNNITMTDYVIYLDNFE